MPDINTASETSRDLPGSRFAPPKNPRFRSRFRKKPLAPLVPPRGHDGEAIRGDIAKIHQEGQEFALQVNETLDLDDPLTKDYQTMVQGNPIAENIQAGAETSKNFLSQAWEAISAIFGSLGQITKAGVSKTARSPKIATGIAGVGGLYAGIQSIKSLLKTWTTFNDPKSSKSSWLVHGLLTTLLGGAALGFASPFLGNKSPFVKRVDGKDIVELQSIIGGVLATVLLSIFMSLAEGQSILNKLPFIGKPLEEISSTINTGISSVTTSTPKNNQGAPGGGMPGLGG